VVALFVLEPIKGKTMEAGSTARVWKDGRLQRRIVMTPRCRRSARRWRGDAQHPNAGVRAVILMVDQPAATPEPAVTPVPVYVDVFESGFSQDSGYGYGV
jgi:hypothetical protein